MRIILSFERLVREATSNQTEAGLFCRRHYRISVQLTVGQPSATLLRWVPTSRLIVTDRPGLNNFRFADYPPSTAVSGPRDKLYGMCGYFDIARLGGYYSRARGQRNQEKMILCFQSYFLISAGQFCTRVKG